jgi:hypothetical protein
MAVGVVSLLQEQPACFVGSTGSGSHSLARSLAHTADGRTDRQTQALKAANTRRRGKASVHLGVSDVKVK